MAPHAFDNFFEFDTTNNTLLPILIPLPLSEDLPVRDLRLLNRFTSCDKFNESKILIAGKNFGCGSSREHAPWALLDFGIKCVISPSFADIFYNNCFKNGMLPIVLDQKQLEELIEYSERKEAIEINLPEQKIKLGNKIISFEVDAFKKKCLLNGLDDIALSLEQSEKISSYENKLKKNKPWIN